MSEWMNEWRGKIYGLLKMENICSVGVYYDFENVKREDFTAQNTLCLGQWRCSRSVVNRGVLQRFSWWQLHPISHEGSKVDCLQIYREECNAPTIFEMLMLWKHPDSALPITPVIPSPVLDASLLIDATGTAPAPLKPSMFTVPWGVAGMAATV